MTESQSGGRATTARWPARLLQKQGCHALIVEATNKYRVAASPSEQARTPPDFPLRSWFQSDEPPSPTPWARNRARTTAPVPTLPVSLPRQLSRPQPLTGPSPDLGFTPAPQVSDPWTVQKVLETIPGSPAPSKGTTSPLAFFHMVERLKTTKREGWRRFGIDR